MQRRRVVFPVGLYGMLLFATCWLTLRDVLRPVERVLVGAACQVPRFAAAFAGQPAAAAASEPAAAHAALVRDLAERTARHEVAGARAVFGAGLEPRVCTVVAALRRGGGSAPPTELRLDCSHADLARCEPWVTKGDVLLGRLVRPGRGAAADDEPHDAARIALLNDPASPPSYAAMPLPEGGSLRLVVRAAAAVDPAPLRVELWDNPYRAARLAAGGQPVHTLAAPLAPDAPPPGLLLGTTRIWGYEAPDEAPLAIGVFVAPPFDARALSHVVVWQRPEPHATDGDDDGAVGAAQAMPARREQRGVRRLPATVQELPGAARGRYLVVADEALPDGAAVVHGGVCLGTVRGLAFGTALLTSFASTRHAWNLVLLPEVPAERPRELRGEIVPSADGAVWLRCRGEPAGARGGRLPAGHLFTGSNGPHCPVGLLLGSVRPHALEPDLLVFQAPLPAGALQAEVTVGEDRP